MYWDSRKQDPLDLLIRKYETWKRRMLFLCSQWDENWKKISRHWNVMTGNSTWLWRRFWLSFCLLLRWHLPMSSSKFFHPSYINSILSWKLLVLNERNDCFFSFSFLAKTNVKIKLKFKQFLAAPPCLHQTKKSCLSYKHFTLVNYDSRLVITSKFLILTTLGS